MAPGPSPFPQVLSPTVTHTFCSGSESYLFESQVCVVRAGACDPPFEFLPSFFLEALDKMLQVRVESCPALCQLRSQVFQAGCMDLSLQVGATRLDHHLMWNLSQGMHERAKQRAKEILRLTEETKSGLSSKGERGLGHLRPGSKTKMDLLKVKEHK